MRDKLLIAFTLIIAIAALMIAGERVRGIAFNTAKLSAAVVVFAVPVGTLIALLLSKVALPGRRMLLALFAVMLFVPLYLHAASWQAALGVSGWLTPEGDGLGSWAWIDGWRGAIWIHSVAALPWIVCIVAAAARRTSGEAEAAASLAVPPWRVLWSITLPSLWPAIAIASLWTAMSVAVEMTVTNFFQIRTFAEEVYTAASLGGFQTDNPTEDYAPQSIWFSSTGLVAGTLLLAALTFVILASITEYLRQQDFRPSQRAWQWQPAVSRWWLAAVPVAAMLLILVLPVVSLVMKAGLGTEQTAEGWQRTWSVGELMTELARVPGSQYREAWQSLVLGVSVATAATLFGIPLAWHLRVARRRPNGLLAILAVAMAVPGPVLALVVIWALNRPVDSMLWWIYELYDSLFAPWLVQTLRLVPVATLTVLAGFASLPKALVDSARVDGIPSWQQLLQLAIPLTWRMIVVAWLVSFTLSVGELASTILVMPPGRPTLAIHLFQLLHYGVEAQVSAVALWVFAILLLVAIGIVWIVPKDQSRQS